MRPWLYALCVMFVLHSDAADPGGPRATFVMRSVVVDGRSYRYQVYLPPDWSAQSRWPVILSLHGGGGYGSDGVKPVTEGLAPAIRMHPERFPEIAVFPQSPDNGTPGWQQIGGRIALAALDDTLAEFFGDPARVTLTGMSIGGNGAWYLAYRHPERFARLLVICGFVSARKGVMQPILYPAVAPGVADPFGAVAHRLAAKPVWIVHGALDHTVSVEESRRMATALRDVGAAVRYTELPGVDHDAWTVTYARPEIAEWMLAH